MSYFTEQCHNYYQGLICEISPARVREVGEFWIIFGFRIFPAELNPSDTDLLKQQAAHMAVEKLFGTVCSQEVNSLHTLIENA